ncbi:MAG: DNA mismatch repair endonuclease MutL, partial [Saprospiraceae bacterium]
RLVPVEEETEAVRIYGFVGKPDYYKKTRGEQFFFINRRFIKNNYLHHAILGAYEGLLPDDAHPLYVLFIDIDPARVDVNVHPTKQEIKFDDDKLVYNILKVAVRHALGRHNVTPTLDFDQEPAFNASPTSVPQPPPPATVGAQRPPADRRDAENLRNWQRAYEGLESAVSKPREENPTPGADFIRSVFADILLPDTEPESEPPAQRSHAEIPSDNAPDLGLEPVRPKDPFQAHGLYLISQIKSGLMIIDQQAASERILYERYLSSLRSAQHPSQKLLFPRTINLSPRDADSLREIIDEIHALGFEVTSLGGSTFAIHGAPAGLDEGQNEELILQRLIAQYQENLDLSLDLQDNVARAMARSAALRKGRPLDTEAMHELINQLFACEMPFKSPYGKRCFITIELDELLKRFNE